MAPLVERPHMPDYGVPDDDDGLLPWSWAEERLSGSRNYWIASVSSDGRPHNLPVWGVWLPGAERFWFSCAPGSRKARNLRASSGVVVAPTDTVEVVSLEGAATDTTGADIDTAIDTYFAKYGEEMGMGRGDVGTFLTDNASFEVVPDRAFGIIERPDEFSQRATRWRWPSA